MTETAPVPALRLATLPDVPAIVRLIDDSIRGLAPGHYDAAGIERSLGTLYGVDSLLIQDGTYYVIEGRGAIVAAGGWSRRLTPYGGDLAGWRDTGVRRTGIDAAVVRAFYVHPGWARRGLGRRLLEACESAAYAEGFTRIELTSTLMGLAFYAAGGYREVRPVDIALPDGTILPHVLMTKP